LIIIDFIYKLFTIMIFDLNENIKSFIRYSEFNDTITGLSFPDCSFFILNKLNQPEMYRGSRQDDTCHMCSGTWHY